MDPVSQAALGAIAAQNAARSKRFGLAALLGALSGMAPDLDFLIRSSENPLLSLEYHRHFTHSLIFIPIGGAVCALILHPVARRFKRPPAFRDTLFYCAVGYATHAFLDACTSYGTQLFWPFSDMRVSWGNISIVDPLFTIPLLFLVIFAVATSKIGYARAAMIWAAAYLCFGAVQKERAEAVGLALAASRGDEPERVAAMPGFANMFVWRSIYEADGKFQIDGVRVTTRGGVLEGGRIAKIDVARDFPWLSPDSRQARDLERFRWFADGFIAVHPDYPDRVIDLRYSRLPHTIKPLWMIRLDPFAGTDEHVEHIDGSDGADSSENLLGKWWKMVKGRGEFEPREISDAANRH